MPTYDLLPLETIATTMAVVVDELWRRTVPKTPIMRPAIGFFTTSLLEKTSPAFLPPRSWKDEPRKLKEHTNR